MHPASEQGRLSRTPHWGRHFVHTAPIEVRDPLECFPDAQFT